MPSSKLSCSSDARKRVRSAVATDFSQSQLAALLIHPMHRHGFGSSIMLSVFPIAHEATRHHDCG